MKFHLMCGIHPEDAEARTNVMGSLWLDMGVLTFFVEHGSTKK